VFFYKIIYYCALRLYGLAIYVAAMAGQQKAKLWVAGRKNQLLPHLNESTKNSPRFWVHCSSLGEFEQGRPLIEALKKKYPTGLVWLTFFSPSGYEVRKNYALADWVGYMPLDTPQQAQHFIGTLQPTAVIFVKYEYWYWHLYTLQQKNIATYLISAQFRPEEVFFKWYGAFFRQILHLYRHIFVQNQKSADLLQQIGIHNATIAGDTRFDRVAETARQALPLPIVAQFKANSLLLVAGSTWLPDEQLLADALFDTALAAKLNLKLVIAPHEINQPHLDQLYRLLSEKFNASPQNSNIVYYSQLTTLNIAEQKQQLDGARVLIIDNIGMLSSIYGYADYAYIGGGFGKGIHNILEAAVFGVPLFFGSNYHIFQEAHDLIALQAAFCVRNAHDLQDKLAHYPTNSPAYQQLSQTCRQYVADKCGAVNKIMSFNLLEWRT
jgi:3-deoxy-D-manno-octulosonic-acid transferase